MEPARNAIPSSPAASARILALDRLRGLAMVLMVIDHVRVFAGVPASGAVRLPLVRGREGAAPRRLARLPVIRQEHP